MKPTNKMMFEELEKEAIANRSELREAEPERKRELIARNTDLIAEMDRRWKFLAKYVEKYDTYEEAARAVDELATA